MYAIVNDTGVLGYTDEPIYVKKKNGVWINCDPKECEAIAYRNTAYEGAIAHKEDGGYAVYVLEEDNKNIYIELTESEIQMMTQERQLTDAEIAILELQQQN